MKNLSKNTRLIDLESETEWTFDCRTRAPDAPSADGTRPKATWTYIVYNKTGERRFIPEDQMAATFRFRDN